MKKIWLGSVSSALLLAAAAAQAQSSYLPPISQRPGAKLDQAAGATVAATIGNSTFSWANQAGASVSGGGTSPLVITQPFHTNTTRQAVMTTAMPAASACYSTMLQSPNNSSLYNSGMALTGPNGVSVVFESVYANDSQSNIYVQTETDFTGANRNPLSQGSYPNYTANSQIWERICVDVTAQQASFLISPTGKLNSFQLLTTRPLAALGNPNQIGFYVDADPQDGNTSDGTLGVIWWQPTAGLNPQAHAPGGDYSADFLTAPTAGNGFPVSNYVPTVAGDTPRFGIALAPGANNVVDMTFPGSGDSKITVPDGATLRKYVYLNFDVGDLNSLVGSPQDSGQGPTAAFWGRARSYPVGDVSDLTVVTANGLKVKARCGGHGRHNCVPDQIRSGFFRLPTVFRPGMAMEITIVPATGFHSWNPWWLYTGQQLTPFPNSDAYAPNLSYVSHGPNFEIDMNDNFPRADYGGCPVGGQVDFGTPDIYGTRWSVPPHMLYAANSNGWTSNNYGDPRNSSSNNYECETGFVAGSRRTILFNWRGDGSNILDLYVNGRRVNSAYMEYPQTQSFTDPDGVVRQLGMTMLFGGQNVPAFDPATTILDNDGIVQTPIADAGWTQTFFSIKAWDKNVASPESYNAGVNAVH